MPRCFICKLGFQRALQHRQALQQPKPLCGELMGVALALHFIYIFFYNHLLHLKSFKTFNRYRRVHNCLSFGIYFQFVPFELIYMKILLKKKSRFTANAL